MITGLSADDLELETFCGRCYGAGKRNGEICPTCAGTGQVMTVFGEAVLAFVKKHLKAPTGGEQE